MKKKEIILSGIFDDIVNTVKNVANAAKEVTATVTDAKQQIKYITGNNGAVLPAAQQISVSTTGTSANTSADFNKILLYGSIAGLSVLAITFFLTGKKRK